MSGCLHQIPSLKTPGAEDWRDAVGSSYPKVSKAVKYKALLHRLDVSLLLMTWIFLPQNGWEGWVTLKPKGRDRRIGNYRELLLLGVSALQGIGTATSLAFPFEGRKRREHSQWSLKTDFYILVLADTPQYLYFFLSTALINYHLRYLVPLPNLIVGNAEISLAIPSPINGKEKGIVLCQGQVKQTELMLFSLTLVNQWRGGKMCDFANKTKTIIIINIWCL